MKKAVEFTDEQRAALNDFISQEIKLREVHAMMSALTKMVSEHIGGGTSYDRRQRLNNTLSGDAFLIEVPEPVKVMGTINLKKHGIPAVYDNEL
jgi:hypothetical protein